MVIMEYMSKHLACGLQNLRVNSKSFTRIKQKSNDIINEGTEFEAVPKQLVFQFSSDRASKRVRISRIKRLLSLSCLSVRTYQLSHIWTDFR
jgi:hypothetical protein